MSKEMEVGWTISWCLTHRNQWHPCEIHHKEGISCSLLNTHTHTRLMVLFPGLPRWAGTRKVIPIWILLKQETVSGSGISWAICKSAPRYRQHTTIQFLQARCPSCRPTNSIKAQKALLDITTGENRPFLAVSIEATPQFTWNWFQVHEVTEASTCAFTVSNSIRVNCHYHSSSTQAHMHLLDYHCPGT